LRTDAAEDLGRVVAIPGMIEAKLRAVVRCGHEADVDPRR
jgi:hypothetical protein